MSYVNKLLQQSCKFISKEKIFIYFLKLFIEEIVNLKKVSKLLRMKCIKNIIY